jgi:TonB family protein
VALREKFGRLVLLEETEVSALGREYRAARLGSAGIDRLVGVLRFSPAVSQDAAATKSLMDEARLAARLSNPGLQRVLGIGRVDQAFYVSTELVEGRTLAAIIERCARDSFPFAADHALMVASRAASALEYLHGKKDDSGEPLLHGLLAPRHLVVLFDGEVKLKGLGLWRSLGSGPHLPEGERAYLAPEQAAGGAGDARSDVYSLARVLLASVTLSPADGRDPLAVLAEARVTAPTGESSPVPRPLADLLRRALAPEPAARYASMAELRKAIDTLLFSGDFTPTTFDLAFFMHTLFRDEMEAEGRTLEDERRADYREFLSDEKTAGAAPAADPGARPPSPIPPGMPATEVKATIAESVRATAESLSSSASAPTEAPTPTRDTSPRAREAAAREAASRLALGAVEPARGRGGLWVGIAVALLALAAAGGWYVKSRGGFAPAPAPTATPVALSPEAQAAMARVKELETRIAQLEGEKAAAEAKAAEDARKAVEAQAAAKGRAVDPQAVERAQEEARQRARVEQETKQQEERQRLAAARRTEEERLAEASPTPAATAPVTGAPPAAAAPPPAATPIPTPMAATPKIEATPATVSATPGVVTPTPANAPAASAPAAAPEPKLVPPIVLSQVPARYPPLAQQRGIAGVVEVSALVDETGKVVETNVVRADPKGLGFEEAAVTYVRSRKYRPANRDGEPVRVWVSIVVDFKPQR